MTNNSETVREVFNKLLKYPLAYDWMSEECVIPKYKVERYISRALAAHERELAAKDAEIARLKASLLTICTADKTAEGLREIAIDACNGKEVK